MRYLTQPKFRKYVKGYDFLSFGRRFNNKYGKKLIHIATKTGIYAAKTASNRVVQKISEAKIADKITSIGKPQEKETKEIEEIYIPPRKRQQIIDIILNKILFPLHKN